LIPIRAMAESDFIVKFFIDELSLLI